MLRSTAMELYDPEFPCESDVTDLPCNIQKEEDSFIINQVERDAFENKTSVDAELQEDFVQINDVSLIELPPTEPEANTVSDSDRTDDIEIKLQEARDIVRNLESNGDIEKSCSDSAEGYSIEKADDIDGEVLEDETSYRDELKKLTASHQTRDSETKATKDVLPEMYLGPSVGFRVDLTMNKSKKSSVESIARRRHELSLSEDLFERVSPDHREKHRSRSKTSSDGLLNGNKPDFKSRNKNSTPSKSDTRGSSFEENLRLRGEIELNRTDDNSRTADDDRTGDHSRVTDHNKPSEHNKTPDHGRSVDHNRITDHGRMADHSRANDRGDGHEKVLDRLLSRQEGQAPPESLRSSRARQSDSKIHEKSSGRPDDLTLSHKSKQNESDKEDGELPSRKRSEYGEDLKRSKLDRHESHVESTRDLKDKNSAKKSKVAVDHLVEKEPKSSSKRHKKDENGGRHHGSKDQRSEDAERKGRHRNRSKSRGKEKEKQRDSRSNDEAPHKKHKRRRNSRSMSPVSKKKSRRSKSKSPKRHRKDRSKSTEHRPVRESPSRLRERNERTETRSKHEDRHHVEHRQKTDARRHRQSRSRTPTIEVESRKRRRSKHSDYKDSSFTSERWDFDERNSRNDKSHLKSSSLRELPEKSTSLFEACMRTRYENQGLGEEVWQSRSFHRTREGYGSGNVDYITVSDSDEGIVWSDNDEEYADYSHMTEQMSISKKQKFEDIYSSRGRKSSEKISFTRSGQKSSKSSRQRESSLALSEDLGRNLNRKENTKRLEKLKVTKSVSRSSLEPGEIDDRSSVSSAGNDLIEDLSPAQRKVSLLGEDDSSRPPGNKVPIQIHVITSHGGDSRRREKATTEFDENMTEVVTTTGETEGGSLPEPTDEKLQKCHLTDTADKRESESEKDLTEKLVIISRDGTPVLEIQDEELEEKHATLSLEKENILSPPFLSDDEEKLELSKKGDHGEDKSQKEAKIGSSPITSKDPVTKLGFDPDIIEDDVQSPPHQLIPGLGEELPSPAGDKEAELPPRSSTRDITSSQPSFYQIKKKSQPEVTLSKPDATTDLVTPKHLGFPLASPHKTAALASKEDVSKQHQPSPRRSPVLEHSLATFGHLTSSAPSKTPLGLLKTVNSTGNTIAGSDDLATPDGELNRGSIYERRPGKSSLPSCNANLLTNPFALNQNTIMDILAPLQNSVAPTLSSLMANPVSTAVASHSDSTTPMSKILAAFTLAATSTSGVNPARSQKLIDDLVKSTSVSSPLPAVEIAGQPSRPGFVDDQLTNIINMQKKLNELSRISSLATQPAVPISQKLVQDIFKAVLPTISGAPDLSNLCPRPSERSCSMTDDNSPSDSSPLDYRTPSFSPPSLPDKNSPGKDLENAGLPSTKPALDQKGSALKLKKKEKPVKSNFDELAKDKKSKVEIQKLVVDEVKMVIKPFYSKGRINKDEYKEILRKTVPKICHSKTQDFSKTRITIYVEAYIRKVIAMRKYNAKKRDQ